MVLGQYAPMEPGLIKQMLRFLRLEKKFPLGLTHRIIDRLASITVRTTVMSHAEIVRFIQAIPEDFAIANGPCACRIHTAAELGPDARDLVSGRFDLFRQTPLNVDVQIAKSGEIFGTLPAYKRISKDELLALEYECFNMGLVSNIYVMMEGESGVCHCSSATCVPFMANEAIGRSSSVIRKGAYVSVTDSTVCTGEGICAQVCHFGARRTLGNPEKRWYEADQDRCYGCGICAAVCPKKAITMVARSG